MDFTKQGHKKNIKRNNRRDCLHLLSIQMLLIVCAGLTTIVIEDLLPYVSRKLGDWLYTHKRDEIWSVLSSCTGFVH